MHLLIGGDTAQEVLSIEVSSLMEDPEAATVKSIARQAYFILSLPAAGVADSSAGEEERVSWLVPFPVSVQMRLFCLPYAGGVSENVFAKCEARARTDACVMKFPVLRRTKDVGICCGCLETKEYWT